ncbi:MAG: NTP transferase domain-containing protein [Actinomycetota bacterium]
MVLAGGRSTRFGAADKLAARVDGIPLLHHPVLRLAEVVGQMIVVLAPGADRPAMPPGVPVRLVNDATADEGPLAGALAGLRATETEIAVVVGGDMPTLVTDVLREMLRVAIAAAVEAVTLQDGEGFRPLPLVLRVAPATEVAHVLLHDGERRLRALPQGLHTAIVDEATWRTLDPRGATLVDIDVPDDLPGSPPPDRRV